MEELTQILGLANDSDDVKRSMFVKKNQYSEVGSKKCTTAGDRLMLKVFYDPTIKVGMPRPEALQLAFNILKIHSSRRYHPPSGAIPKKADEITRDWLARPSWRM